MIKEFCQGNKTCSKERKKMIDLEREEIKLLLCLVREEIMDITEEVDFKKSHTQTVKYVQSLETLRNKIILELVKDRVLEVKSIKLGEG